MWSGELVRDAERKTIAGSMSRWLYLHFHRLMLFSPGKPDKFRSIMVSVSRSSGHENEFQETQNRMVNDVVNIRESARVLAGLPAFASTPEYPEAY